MIHLSIDNFFPSEAKRVSLPQGEICISLTALVLGGSCISSFSRGLIKLICKKINLKPIKLQTV